MIAKLLFQLIAYLTSALLLGAFTAGTYERWSASKGPLATATISDKTDYRPKKSAVQIYELHLSFKAQNQGSIITETEVSRDAYAANPIKGSVAINYDASHPQNAVLATDGWFQYRSLGVLALGLTFLYAAATVKEAKRKQNT